MSYGIWSFRNMDNIYMYIYYISKRWAISYYHPKTYGSGRVDIKGLENMVSITCHIWSKKSMIKLLKKIMNLGTFLFHFKIKYLNPLTSMRKKLFVNFLEGVFVHCSIWALLLKPPIHHPKSEQWKWKWKVHCKRSSESGKWKLTAPLGHFCLNPL